MKFFIVILITDKTSEVFLQLEFITFHIIHETPPSHWLFKEITAARTASQPAH